MASSNTPITESADRSPRTGLMAAAVGGLTAVLYAASLRFDFVYDDRNQILLNPLIRSWTNIWWLFKTDVWAFWNPLYVGNYWRPLFMVWLLFNHSLFALNPAGWHALAVLTHVVAVCFVFYLALELSEDALLAMFAALLFAVHPSHVETVAWISGATDSLMADFLLPSLLCFIRGWKSNASAKKWLWLLGSALLFGCALLVKETAVVLAPLAICYAVIFGDDSWKARLKRVGVAVLPLLAVCVIYMVCRRAVLHGVRHDNLQMSFGSILISSPALLWFYLKHLVWPFGLGLYYEIPPVQAVGWLNFWLPLLGCLIVGIGFAIFCWRRRDRLCAFGAVFLLLPILPVLYIPGLPIDDFAHDRYLYLPSIGFSLIVASLVRRLPWGSKTVFGVPATQFATAAVLIIGLCVGTASQQIYWASDVLLFTHAVEVAPGSANAFNNLGVALTARGRMKEARFAFEQVIKRNPNSAIALYNLGLGSFFDGDYSEADRYLSRAVKLAPLEADGWAVLAESQIHEDRFADAEASIRTAIQLRAFKPGYQRVLASALEGQGKTLEALKAAESELKRDPADPQTQQLLARIRGKLKAGNSDIFSSHN